MIYPLNLSKKCSVRYDYTPSGSVVQALLHLFFVGVSYHEIIGQFDQLFSLIVQTEQPLWTNKGAARRQPQVREKINRRESLQRLTLCLAYNYVSGLPYYPYNECPDCYLLHQSLSIILRRQVVYLFDPRLFVDANLGFCIAQRPPKHHQSRL